MNSSIKRSFRVVIADDHPLVGEGLAALLRPEFVVLGVVTDGWQVIEAAERLRPDVITLDISMPKLSGLEAARRLKKILPRTKLIFVTQEADIRYLRAALGQVAVLSLPRALPPERLSRQ